MVQLMSDFAAMGAAFITRNQFDWCLQIVSTNRRTFERDF